MKRENPRNSGIIAVSTRAHSKSNDLPLHALPRLFVAPDLGLGTVISCDSNQSHYLGSVLRLDSSDSVRVFNGRDGDWRGKVSPEGKKHINIIVTEQLVNQSPLPDICLYCAPLKKAFFEYMVMKATELGVMRIQPILTQRTQIRDVNKERIWDIAKEASEQSERLSVPIIEEVHGFNWLLSHKPSDQTLLFCAEHGFSQPIHEALESLNKNHLETKKKPSFGILVGPEGGFTKDEMEQLRNLANSLPVSLGPRILRADTAALAALSCLQSVCGDWNLRPETR